MSDSIFIKGAFFCAVSTALLLTLSSCGTSSKEIPYTIPKNAERLVAGDSLKIWKLASRINKGTRMNMGDCFLSYRITYRRDKTLSDNSGEYPDCGETLHAEWKFTKDENGHFYIKWTGDQISDLLNIEDDFKYFKLKKLSKDTMVLSYYHQQFSSKVTKITDYLVPNNLVIENRDFHW